MHKKIFCVGGATVDYKFKFGTELKLATSNPVTVVKNFGGVARNIAENLSHWTKSIYLQTVIGNDIEGQSLLNHLHRLNINTEATLEIPGATTARYYALLDPAGELHIACADMAINDLIDANLFRMNWKHWHAHDLIFFDTNLPTPVIENAINFACEKNLCLCIDPVSVVKAKKLPQCLQGIYLLKPNRLETESLTGMKTNNINDCIHAGLQLISRGVKNIVITLAEEGYVLVNASLQRHVSRAKPIEIKDVNGAGDTFMAGVLHALQQDANLLEACEWGSAAAQLTLQSESNIAVNPQ